MRKTGRNLALFDVSRRISGSTGTRYFPCVGASVENEGAGGSVEKRLVQVHVCVGNSGCARSRETLLHGAD